MGCMVSVLSLRDVNITNDSSGVRVLQLYCSVQRMVDAGSIIEARRLLLAAEVAAADDVLSPSRNGTSTIVIEWMVLNIKGDHSFTWLTLFILRPYHSFVRGTCDSRFVLYQSRLRSINHLHLLS